MRKAFQALVTGNSKGHAALLTCADALLVESKPRMSMFKMISKVTPEHHNLISVYIALDRRK